MRDLEQRDNLIAARNASIYKPIKCTSQRFDLRCLKMPDTSVNRFNIVMSRSFYAIIRVMSKRQMKSLIAIVACRIQPEITNQTGATPSVILKNVCTSLTRNKMSAALSYCTLYRLSLRNHGPFLRLERFGTSPPWKARSLTPTMTIHEVNK